MIVKSAEWTGRLFAGKCNPLLKLRDMSSYTPTRQGKWKICH